MLESAFEAYCSVFMGGSGLWGCAACPRSQPQLSKAAHVALLLCFGSIGLLELLAELRRSVVAAQRNAPAVG